MHRSHKIIFITIGIVAILSIALTLLPKYTNQQKPTVANKDPNAVIMKVKDENIYQKDFDYELSQMPRPDQNSDQSKQVVTQKLIDDSVTIQEAVKEKLTTVDSSLYNSNSKNYTGRLQVVSNIKKLINDRADRIEGTVVTIWFYNSVPPKMGIEKAKEVVKAKITDLHEQVKSKKITVKEAVDRIKKDASLKEIDAAYQTNSSLPFNAVFGNKITIDKQFDQMLWQLKDGEVSDVYALKATNKLETANEELLYAFAIMDRRTSTGQKNDYELWLKENSKQYEITQY